MSFCVCLPAISLKPLVHSFPLEILNKGIGIGKYLTLGPQEPFHVVYVASRKRGCNSFWFLTVPQCALRHVISGQKKKEIRPSV